MIKNTIKVNKEKFLFLTKHVSKEDNRAIKGIFLEASTGNAVATDGLTMAIFRNFHELKENAIIDIDKNLISFLNKNYPKKLTGIDIEFDTNEFDEGIARFKAGKQEFKADLINFPYPNYENLFEPIDLTRSKTLFCVNPELLQRFTLKGIDSKPILIPSKYHQFYVFNHYFKKDFVGLIMAFRCGFNNTEMEELFTNFNLLTEKVKAQLETFNFDK